MVLDTIVAEPNEQPAAQTTLKRRIELLVPADSITSQITSRDQVLALQDLMSTLLQVLFIHIIYYRIGKIIMHHNTKFELPTHKSSRVISERIEV